MRLYLMKMKPMSNQGIQNWSRALRPKLTKWVFKGSIGVDLDLKDTESFKRFEEWLYKHVGNIMVQIREQDKKQLTRYLKRCMERKKLQRVRDVQYNIELGKIISIPGLLFIEKKQKFTLKNTDKKGSTLKSLAPKKRIRKKIRKKDKVKTKDNEEDKKNKNNK